MMPDAPSEFCLSPSTFLLSPTCYYSPNWVEVFIYLDICLWYDDSDVGQAEFLLRRTDRRSGDRHQVRSQGEPEVPQDTQRQGEDQAARLQQERWYEWHRLSLPQGYQEVWTPRNQVLPHRVPRYLPPHAEIYSNKDLSTEFNSLSKEL